MDTQFSKDLKGIYKQVIDDLRDFRRTGVLSEQLHNLVPSEFLEAFKDFVRHSSALEPRALDLYAEYLHRLVRARREYLKKFRNAPDQTFKYFDGVLLEFLAGVPEDDFQKFLGGLDNNNGALLNDYMVQVGPVVNNFQKELLSSEPYEMESEQDPAEDEAEINSLLGQISQQSQESFQLDVEVLRADFRRESSRYDPDAGRPQLPDNTGSVIGEFGNGNDDGRSSSPDVPMMDEGGNGNMGDVPNEEHGEDIGGGGALPE